jgi:tetratricopeptide (TPR) repeat protein
MRNSGQSGQAALRYREAYKELTAFKEANPTWHQNIVEYRLNYMLTQLQPLGGLGTETAPATAPQSPTESRPPGDPGDAAGQLAQWQNEIQRLNTQHALLQDKLKEAWAAQPTALDPRQLAAAESRIRELEKERDLLAITLEQKQFGPLPTATPELLAQESRILEAVQRELAEQRQINKDLALENESLKLQVSSLKIGTPVSPLPDSDLARQYSDAQATIESLRTTNVALRTDQILLEMRLADLTKAALNTASQDRVQTLESELRHTRSDFQTLKKDYAKLESQLASARRRSEKGDPATLANDLTQAQVRLAVFEEQAVPYTPEELALVNHPPTLQLSTTNAPVLPPQKAFELPPGAGPLWAQADRAIERGQFEEAEQKLRDILLQDENNVFTLSRLASVLIDREKREDAEQVLHKALVIDPNDPLGNYLLGWLKYHQEKFEDAFIALGLAAKVNPSKPETQYYLGLTLIQIGNRGPAETALRKAIQLRPDWGAPHYELAFVYATQ